MYKTQPVKAAKAGYIVVSASICLFGLVLILFPGIAVSVICRFTGIIMILFGAVKLCGYFSKDLYRLAFQYDLVFGILLIALGIVMLAIPNNVIGFICVVLGIYLMADSLFKIQIAFDAKKFGIKNWWMILVLAAAAWIIGFLLVIRPTESAEALVTLFGVSLLAEGILSMSVTLLAVKIIGHQKPDVIEVTDFDLGKD